MNKYLRVCMMVAVAAIMFTAVDALAAEGGNDVFSTVLNKLLVTFKNIRNVIFVVGGFGLVGLGFAAIFGKVKWPWLAALACGLAIVALAGAMVDYVTHGDDSDTSLDYTADWDDTLGGD